MGKSEENREEMEKEQTSSGISREERENRLSSLGVRAPFRVLEDFFAIVKKRRKNENCGPFSLTFSLFSLLLLVSPKRDGKKKRFCFHCSFYTQQTQQFYNTKTVGFVMVLFPPCRAYLALHGVGQAIALSTRAPGFVPEFLQGGPISPDGHMFIVSVNSPTRRFTGLGISFARASS
jgi:hypothetical protein